MEMREEARPMTDEEFKAWMDRKRDMDWALGSDGRPDSTPLGVAWMIAGAVGVALIVFAIGIFKVLS